MTEGGLDVCPICRTSIGEHGGHAAPAVAAAAAASAGQQFTTSDEPVSTRERFRIPCPNGHVNVAPAHLVGTRVVCPKCNTPYELHLADSLEYRQVAEREAREREEKQAKKWLNRAIFAAVFIVVSLVGMIVFSMIARTARQNPGAVPALPR